MASYPDHKRSIGLIWNDEIRKFLFPFGPPGIKLIIILYEFLYELYIFIETHHIDAIFAL